MVRTARRDRAVSPDASKPSAQGGSETEFTPIGPTGWLRGGLDITA